MEPMKGETIPLPNGDAATEGYLSIPASGRGPGVVVVQEWWGLVGHIKDVCDRFADEGFVALAPDLFQGETADEPDEAGTLMMALNIAKTDAIFRKTILTLLAHPAVERGKVGVVGFCMGGQLAMFAAAGNPAIGACVNFYGIHPNVQPVFRDLNAPLLGIFAETDDYASPDAVNALDSELRLLDKPHEFITYPGTHHAFFNNDRPAYNEGAAEDAWKRTIEFLKANLP